MEKLYIQYRENPSEGLDPSAIEIFVSYINPNEDKGEVNQLDVIETRKTPRQVIRELERAIKKTINENPTSRDILTAYPVLDIEPVNRNSPRSIGYLAEGFWPKRGQSEEDAESGARKRTKERNKKIHQTYTAYIKTSQKR